MLPVGETSNDLSPRITWDKSFETGHAGVDTEHRRLVRLLNRLCDASATNGADLLPVLTELQRYTEYHFANESQLMREFGISEAHCKAHLSGHAVFVSKLNEACRRAKHEPAGVTAELITYLGRWLLMHIMGMDRDLIHETGSGGLSA